MFYILVPMDSSDLLNEIMYGNIHDDDTLITKAVHPRSRGSRFRYERVNMEYYMVMCRETDGFKCRHHMTEKSYHRLVRILTPGIQLNYSRSGNSTSNNDVITPQMITCIGLRYMGGELNKSLADIFGMSIDTCDRVIDLFLLGVDMSTHEDLSIDLLQVTIQQKINVANQWHTRSGANGCFYGHLLSIDGWLCTTQMPSDVPNPTDYRSGHYQRYGLNVQAMCDPNLRFAYFSVAGPGKMNDARALRRLEGLNIG